MALSSPYGSRSSFFSPRSFERASRVHPVYLYALPVLIVAQTFAVHLYITAAPGWVNIANAILR
jgi:hypothetical protein